MIHAYGRRDAQDSLDMVEDARDHVVWARKAVCALGKGWEDACEMLRDVADDLDAEREQRAGEIPQEEEGP